LETKIVIALAIAVALIAGAVISQLRRPQDTLVASTDESLNQKVERYRDAIKRGTLCERCLAANPGGSRYCADCGKML
jgi:hypothetical protein